MKDALFKKKGFFLPSPPDVAHLPPNVLITPFRSLLFLGRKCWRRKADKQSRRKRKENENTFFGS